MLEEQSHSIHWGTWTIFCILHLFHARKCWQLTHTEITLSLDDIQQMVREVCTRGVNPDAAHFWHSTSKLPTAGEPISDAPCQFETNWTHYNCLLYLLSDLDGSFQEKVSFEHTSLPYIVNIYKMANRLGKAKQEVCWREGINIPIQISFEPDSWLQLLLELASNWTTKKACGWLGTYRHLLPAHYKAESEVTHSLWETRQLCGVLLCAWQEVCLLSVDGLPATKHCVATSTRGVAGPCCL